MLYLMVTLPDVLLILGFHSWCASVTCLIAFDGKRQNIGWSSLRLATWRMNRMLENASADAAIEWGQPTIEKQSKYKGRLANRPEESQARERYSFRRAFFEIFIWWKWDDYTSTAHLSVFQAGSMIELSLTFVATRSSEQKGAVFESRINWKRMVAMKSDKRMPPKQIPLWHQLICSSSSRSIFWDWVRKSISCQFLCFRLLKPRILALWSWCIFW